MIESILKEESVIHTDEFYYCIIRRNIKKYRKYFRSN